jgi:hypothetical protein
VTDLWKTVRPLFSQDGNNITFFPFTLQNDEAFASGVVYVRPNAIRCADEVLFYDAEVRVFGRSGNGP